MNKWVYRHLIPVITLSPMLPFFLRGWGGSQMNLSWFLNLAVFYPSRSHHGSSLSLLPGIGAGPASRWPLTGREGKRREGALENIDTHTHTRTRTHTHTGLWKRRGFDLEGSDWGGREQQMERRICLQFPQSASSPVVHCGEIQAGSGPAGWGRTCSGELW
jgi:hypothetical protein